MRKVLFNISSLQSNKYKKYAKQIDNQSTGKFKDNAIDSEEIKQFKTIILSERKSIGTDKRCDLGLSHPDYQEFAKELDDMMLVFDSLPDDIKKAIRAEINKNKPKLSKEQKAKQEEETKKLQLATKAREEGIIITQDELKLSFDELEMLIYSRKSRKMFDKTFPYGY